MGVAALIREDQDLQARLGESIPRRLIVHSLDFQAIKERCRVALFPADTGTLGAGIDFVEDRLGAVKRGKAISISTVEPTVSLSAEAILPTSEIRYNYLPMAMPRTRLHVGINWAEAQDRRAPRQMWREAARKSQKCRARRQRRLDYGSNARRRKRWAEVKKREGKG